MAKGKGRAATGILCFILGFIFAIIAEVALIFGGVYWALHTDLDKLLSYIGVENTTTNDNGEEENVYINTETASTLSELISAVKDLYSLGTGTLTIGDLDDLFPITGSTIQDIYSSINESVGNDFDLNDIMDYDELLGTAIDDLSEFIADCIKDAQIDLLMKALGVDIEAEPLYMIVAYGSEAGTVTVSGTQYVLYYETYNYDDTEDTYTRYKTVTNDSGTREKVEDNSTTITTGNSNSAYYNLIYSSAIDNRIYYYIDGNGTAYVVTRDNDDTNQDGNIYDATSTQYSLYSENSEYSNITGGYYYDNSGALVILNTRTVDDFMSGGLDSLFYDIYITELMEGDTNDFINELLDGVSLGALLNGEVDFDDLLNNILVTDFLSDSTDQTIKDIFDGVTLGDLIDGTVDFETLLEDIDVVDILGDNVDQTIIDIFDGYTLGDLMDGSFTLDDIYISSFVDVTISGDSSDTIMAYVTYSITDITDVTDGTISYNSEDVTYTHTATVHIYVDDGYGGTTETTYTAYLSTQTESGETTITGVYYSTDSGTTYTEYEGVKVSEISDQASRLMDVLAITDVMEVEADSAIMAYLGYGLSGLTDTTYDNDSYSVYTATYHTYGSSADEDAAYSYNNQTVYVLVDGSGCIYAVYATAADSGNLASTTFSNAISSTPVNNINDRIDGLMNDLTIGDITGIGTADDATNLEKKIGASTINNVSSVIDELTITDVMDAEADSAIMAYLGYGLTNLTDTNCDVTIDSVSYSVYTATYNTYGQSTSDDANYDYDNATVYVLVEKVSDGNTTPTYTDGNILGVYGALASGVTLTNGSTYSALSGLFDTTKELTATPVNNISDRIDGLMDDLTIGDLTGIGTADDATNLEKKIGESTINNVSSVIDSLTVADVMDVEYDSAIMAYLGYGISSITATDNSGSPYTYTVNGTSYNVYTATYHTYDSTNNQSNDAAYNYDGSTVYVLVNGTTKEIYAVYATLTGTFGSDASLSNEISSTPVSYISDRIDGLMNDLKIGEITTLDTSTTIMQKIADCTISEVSTVVNSLTVVDAMGSVDTTVEDAAIMAYLAYGLSGLTDSGYDVTIESVSYSIYTATYKSFTGDTYSTYDEQTVYVLVTKDGSSDDKYIYAVYYQLASGSISSSPTFSSTYEITSTLINNISDRMDGMMTDLTVGDLLGISDSETNPVLLAIKDSTLHSLSSDLESLTLQELYCNYIYVESGTNVADYKVVYKASSSITYYSYNGTDTYSALTAGGSSSYNTLSAYINSLSGISTIYYYNSTTNTYYEVIEFDADYLYFECIIDGTTYNFSYVTGVSSTTGHLSAASDYSSYASGAAVTASVGADGMLYTYGLAQGMWKFLLYKDGVEVAYTVGDISGMTDNAAANIQTATLYDLQSAGIISSTTTLTGSVKRSTLSNLSVTVSNYIFYKEGSVSTEDDATMEIGNLKLSDAITLFVSLLTTANSS